MTGTVRAKRGDSLWSIATGVAPMGASDREVLEVIRLIAEASGIERDSRLKSGQVLTLPESVDRLLDRIRQRPLVHFVPTWRRFEQRPERDLPISEIAGVPLRRARVERFVDAGRDGLHPDALATLNIGFGPLSKVRFEQLVTAFGGRTTVEYRRSRSYSIEDFLPPFVQAVVNQDVEIPPAQRLAGTKGWSSTFGDRAKEVSLDLNSHGTAYETIRHFQTPQMTACLFHGEALAMDELVHTRDVFKTITTASRHRLRRVAKLTLRPGDVVQFYEQTKWSRATLLLHSAVHLGAGLYFEKPSAEVIGEDSPYRLATFDMVAGPVVQAVHRMARVEVLRAVAPLASPATAFRSGLADRLAQLERDSGRMVGHPIVRMLEYSLGGGIDDEQMSAVVELRLAVDDTGRAVIAQHDG